MLAHIIPCARTLWYKHMAKPRRQEKSGKATSGKGASSDVFRPSVLTGVSVAVALQVEDTCTELEEGRAFTLEANLTPSYRLPILRPKSLTLGSKKTAKTFRSIFKGLGLASGLLQLLLNPHRLRE